MSKSEKLSKLGNAIREYRGVFVPETKKWRRPPNPGAARRIRHWLKELGVPAELRSLALADINALKNFAAMREWLTQLGTTEFPKPGEEPAPFRGRVKIYDEA